MQTCALTLVIPGMLNGPLQDSCEDPLARLSIPHLQQLLAKANKQLMPIASSHSADLIFSQFKGTYQPTLPIAAVGALGEQLPADAGFWLRADPIVCAVDVNNAYVLGNINLQLTPTEMAKVRESINALIKDDNLFLYTPNSTQWYLQAADYERVNTRPLPELIGCSMHNTLPEGPDGGYWRKIFTEIQMLLKSHPVNAARAKQQRPEIDSLWFWGEGRLPKPNQQPWQRVWGCTGLTQGLAALAEIPFQLLPASFNLWSGQSHPGHHLMVVEDLVQACEHQQSDIWLAGVHSIAENWLSPLVDALNQKQIDIVHLMLGNQYQYTLTAKHLKRWWKRIKPLSYYRMI